jgi:hypothetical protein
MTLETRFEEADDWTPQKLPTNESNKSMTTATITTTLTRAEMVAAIKLRDPTFVDSTAYSDAYISGRYSGSIAMMPVIGVPKSDDTVQPVTKTDEADLSPVTRAQIAAEKERDRARAAVSLPTKATRTDAADHEGLSEVTKAQILAHERDEARRNNGGNDAAQ